MLKAMTFALSAAASGPQATTPGTTPVFACRMDALDKVQRDRQRVLVETVRRAMAGTRDQPDGIEVLFPADAALFVTLGEWISLERRCCPFLGFALTWTREDTVSVRLSGAPGAKEFIAAEMGLEAR